MCKLLFHNRYCRLSFMISSCSVTASFSSSHMAIRTNTVTSFLLCPSIIYNFQNKILPSPIRLYYIVIYPFRVSVIIIDFCLRVYIIRQKNTRTKVRTIVNVKTPLKAHENNVTLKAMQCQKCRVYARSALFFLTNAATSFLSLSFN